MSDTVFEQNGIAFTRYWGGTEDRVQITVGREYSSLTVKELHDAVKAVDDSVRDTKDAWWHELAKSSNRQESDKDG